MALVLFLPRLGLAQDGRGGSLEGRVTDSIYARPLVGARVVAVGVDSGVAARGFATTDSKGQYRIDSLPAGRYAVGFESPLLDSLEIALSPRQVVVTPGRTATVDLALPPAAKLRDALCPGVSFPPQTGVILGHVVSAETEGSLPGVTIAMSWQELGFDKAKLRPVNGERTVSTVTDDAGWYRVCGVPTGGWLTMQLQHGGRTGPVLRTLVDDTLGLAVRHLSFSPTSSRAAGDSVSSSAAGVDATLLSGTAKLTGVVLGPEGAPVTQAEVRVVGTIASGRTDAQGSYSLSSLPAGTQMLVVRRVGYAVAEAYVELREGATTRSDVRLTRIVSLDSMRVVATRERYPEFSRNRKYAIFGRFFGPDEIHQQRVSYASDIIEKLPGFRIEGTGIQAKVVSGRGVTSVFGECPLRIVLNGAPIDGASVNDVPVAEIGAIEAYRAGDFGPPEYDRGCGAILIWTKR
ncbi:MAG: carboxypeptidase-like regulatory domain-containing protein [bacterium]